MSWLIYYWMSFLISLACLLYVPSQLSRPANVAGSVICAMFGFVLWPLFVTAAFRATFKDLE